MIRSKQEENIVIQTDMKNVDTTVLYDRNQILFTLV
jgi:hypothetical protein